jgi:hypothetical protein
MVFILEIVALYGQIKDKSKLSNDFDATLCQLIYQKVLNFKKRKGEGDSND